jgi:hypothetical protein
VQILPELKKLEQAFAFSHTFPPNFPPIPAVMLISRQYLQCGAAPQFPYHFILK